MKKILAIAVFVGLALGIVAPCAGGEQPAADAALRDSTVSVIGWFCNRDTIVYRIQDSDWKIQQGDTVQTAGISTQVMITVTDSTATGYKMNYTFMDVKADSIPNSVRGALQNKLTALLADKIIGTTISFETDEFGQIVKINDIGKIKKQAKALFKEAIGAIDKQPWIKDLKTVGINIKDYVKDVDTDMLVEGYLEELKLLFMCHGSVYELGEMTEREEATATQYENTTYRSVTIDDDDDSYHIMVDVVSTIPQSDIKTMVSGFVDKMGNADVRSNFDANFDAQVREDCMVNSYFKIDYMPNGWPYSVIKQETTMIGQNGKARQKYIYVEYYSFCNY